MVKIGPIWLDFGPTWSDLVPKVVNKSNFVCFPEMTQNGLEMVPIATGGPGNRFLYYNNVFLYYKTEPFCSYYLLPFFALLNFLFP